MKKIFSAILLSFVLTTSAYAEHEKNTYNSQKPVSCATPDQMLEIVNKRFGEVPYFRGKGIAAAVDGQQFIETNIVIAVNLETKTFSIIEFIAPNLVCIIGGGNEFEFLTPETEKTNIVLEK